MGGGGAGLSPLVGAGARVTLLRVLANLRKVGLRMVVLDVLDCVGSGARQSLRAYPPRLVTSHLVRYSAHMYATDP